MDFFDFAPRTDEEIAAGATSKQTDAPKGDPIDPDVAATNYKYADEEEEQQTITDLSDKPADTLAEKQVVEKPVISSKEEVSDLGSMFEDISDDLEANELLFLPDDAVYEPTPEGLKELLKDNFKAMKDKLEAENNAYLAERLAELEGRGTLKYADMDTADEEHAEHMLTRWYEATGLDEDEIRDKIDELRDLGLTSREAKLAQKFLVRSEKIAEEQQKEAAKQEEIESKQRTIEYIDSIKKAINETTEVLGIKPTSKQKEKFQEYLFKIGRDGKTQAMRDSEDDSKRLKYAWMQYMDFDAKTFETAAKTKVVNEIDKKVKRFASVESSARGVTRREPDGQNSGLKRGALDFWNVPMSDD